MLSTGKLLVSTKADVTGRKTAVIIGTILYVICGIVFFSPGFSDFIGSDTVAIIFGLFAEGYAVYYAIVGWMNLKSYCEVYENAVVGTTTVGFTTNPQNFELRYDEIKNLSVSGKCIQIYTQYTVYKVLALRNAEAAVANIRARVQSVEP